MSEADESIELQFDPELYVGEAIDEAVKLYGEFGQFELSRQADAYVVRVTSTSEHSAQMLADELCNYALGITIERRS